MFYWEFRKKGASLVFPSLTQIRSVSSKGRGHRIPFLLRVFSTVLIILALARPQSGREQTKRHTEGIDIMLIADASGSMDALDFVIDGKRQNRLSVASKALSDFVSARIDDRIGLIVFGSRPYSLAPLTLDHDVLLQLIEGLEVGVAGEQTAIGDALGVAVNRIKDVEGKSKVVILLTDGANDAGKLDPLEIAKAAKTFGVKVYTIGVGSKGAVPIKTNYGYQKVRIPIDEELLQEIADTTGGKYFRATDTEALFKIYKTIDDLEKTTVEIEVFHNYEDHFMSFAWFALCFLFLEFLLRSTRLRRLP